MLQFDFTIAYKPGKSLVIADKLSRAPLLKPDEQDKLFQEDTKTYMDLVVQGLPATEKNWKRLEAARRRI